MARRLVAAAALALAAGLVGLRLGTPPAPALPAGSAPAQLRHAELTPLQQVVRWAVASGDAGGRPFVVVDKAQARVMAYDARGRAQHSVPALLGLARGDDSVPGIGERPMASIQAHERITPAGRFVARRGVNLDGEDIVWVDYGAAVSMHRVRALNPSERRLERLASPGADDNRISYGCINLPVWFYEGVLRPMVESGPTVVYVLPEQRSLHEVFALLGRPALL